VSRLGLRLLTVAMALGGAALAARLGAEAGEPQKLRQVGLCYTGFGVPGSSRPFVLGDLVLINAGEGYPTVIDARDKLQPKVLRYIPSWYFTSAIYPLVNQDLAYLSSSRGRLLVLRGLKAMGSQGDLKEIPWQAAWGRSFLSGLRPEGIGYTVVNRHIIVLDLNDPDQPKEVTSISMPRVWGAKGAVEAGLLTFSDDFRLAAIALDGGLRMGILRWPSATEPELGAEFLNAEAHDKMGGVAYGKALAMDSRHLVIGHPADTGKYWRCLKLSFWDIRDPRKPRRASEIVFHTPGTHVRDIALAGRYAYVVDGRDIHSGHGVGRAQRSRLYVLDTADLTPSEEAPKGDELALEAEGVGSPKVIASWEDTMPTEYSLASLVNGTLYVNDYNYGLWTFDVTDPRKPAKLGGVPVSAEGHWLYLSGDHAYMAHTFGGSVHVISISDAAHPRTVGHYWDGQWLNYKAKIRGKANAMYLPQEDGLAVVDISEPARPRRVGEFVDGASLPLQAPCLDVSDTYAFVVTAPKGKTPSRLLLYDISSPLNPRLAGSIDVPEGKGFRVLLAGGMLYLVGYTGGRIVAIDVSEPTRPRIACDLRAAEVKLGERVISLKIPDGGGNGVPGLGFSRGYLYVATGWEAPAPYILIFDVRDPAAIRPAGTLDVADRKGWQYFSCDLIIEGTRLYIGDYGCEEVYDIADPLAPRRVARYRRSYAWQVGAVRGNLLYVPKLDGLEILEVPQP